MKINRTKDALLKEVAVLRERLEVKEREDERVRRNLTTILRYEGHNPFSNSRSETMTWIDIAFHIGELRADANYSMLLEGREIMRREIEELKNPKP